MKSSDLIEEFASAERQVQLKYLAHLIHWQTILARDLYDQPGKQEQLQLKNEDNHRLAGHLMHLVEHAGPVEVWRLEQIEKIIRKLHPSIRSKLSRVLDQKTKEAGK